MFDHFFEPKLSKETILFVAVFAIFMVGVMFGLKITSNKFAANEYMQENAAAVSQY